MTEEHFVARDMVSYDKILAWLNSLIGQIYPKGKIVKIVDWQVVPTGRPYEYSAFARVEVEKNNG